MIPALKRLTPLFLALALCLSGCSSAQKQTPPTPAEASPAATAEAQPAPRVIGEDAQAYIGPVIEKALEALDKVRRDDLSKVTTPFDPADACEETLVLGAKERAFFDDVCALIVESIPEDASAYDKYRYLGYVVSLCCEYDYEESPESSTPYGALVCGKGICLGYTNAMLYLCQLADLWCQDIHGYASWNGEEHGWDLVMLEDGSYYVDVTWCDQLGEVGQPNWNCYFMLTQEKLAEDHGIWEGGPATGAETYY